MKWATSSVASFLTLLNPMERSLRRWRVLSITVLHEAQYFKLETLEQGRVSGGCNRRGGIEKWEGERGGTEAVIQTFNLSITLHSLCMQAFLACHMHNAQCTQSPTNILYPHMYTHTHTTLNYVHTWSTHTHTLSRSYIKSCNMALTSS